MKQLVFFISQYRYQHSDVKEKAAIIVRNVSLSFEFLKSGVPATMGVDDVNPTSFSPRKRSEIVVEIISETET